MAFRIKIHPSARAEKLKKLDKASLIQALTIVVKSVTVPLTYLVLFGYLSPEEQGYYFVFLSVVAASQVIDAGMSFVAVQSIASLSAKTGERFNNISKIILRRIIFVYSWFLITALLMATAVNLIGVSILASRESIVPWMFPWQFTILAATLNILSNSLGFILEGLQERLFVFKAQLVSSLLFSITMCTCLYSGFGLFSIGLGILSATIYLASLYIRKLLPTIKIIKLYLAISKYRYVINDEFRDLWPFFSKISTTWILGYLYWHSFTLIVFYFEGPILAGEIGVTFGILRTGLLVCESLLSSNRSRLALLISEKDFSSAKERFISLTLLGHFLLFLGYGVFLSVYSYLPDVVTNRLLPMHDLVNFCIAFFIMLFPLNTALYLRCYGVEPFFTFSLSQSIILPIGIYLTLKLGNFEYVSKMFVLFCFAYLVYALKIYLRFGERRES